MILVSLVMSQQLTLSLIQSNILYMKEIGERLFLITNFTAKVACLCRKQIHFFCVQKAGHGDKKKMVIFLRLFTVSLSLLANIDSLFL